MLTDDELQSAMHAVRDDLLRVLGEHEAADHAGEPCWANRANAIAWLCHALGIHTGTPVFRYVAERLDHFDARCPGCWSAEAGKDVEAQRGPLLESELAAIQERSREALGVVNPILPGRLGRSCQDVPRLLAELERVYDRLSTCWLLLDWLARRCADGPMKPLGEKVADLLRRQQAPGWKGD